MAFERKYSDEVRTASVEEVFRRRRAEPGNRAIIREVAEEFAVGPQSQRQWLARYDDGSYDFDDAPAPTTSLSKQELLQRVSELEQRIATLEEDNRSLTRVVAMFADQLRPTAF
jgi:transposase-like protein